MTKTNMKLVELFKSMGVIAILGLIGMGISMVGMEHYFSAASSDIANASASNLSWVIAYNQNHDTSLDFFIGLIFSSFAFVGSITYKNTIMIAEIKARHS